MYVKIYFGILFIVPNIQQSRKNIPSIEPFFFFSPTNVPLCQLIIRKFSQPILKEGGKGGVEETVFLPIDFFNQPLCKQVVDSHEKELDKKADAGADRTHNRKSPSDTTNS